MQKGTLGRGASLNVGLRLMLSTVLATSLCAGGTTIEINEVDSDDDFSGGGAADDQEFIELYDGGGGNVALDGLAVVLFIGASDTSYAAYDLDGFTTDAGGYFVLGGAAVPGVDLVMGATDVLVDAHGSFAAVALYAADASAFPNGTPVTLTNLVDALVYGWDSAPDPGLLPLLSSGGAIPDNFYGRDSSMARCPDGAGGGRDTRSYAAVLASPGGPTACPDPVSFCNAFDGSLVHCPCAPGLPNTGCDRPVPSMQGGGLVGGVRLAVVVQSTSPGNRATCSTAGFPGGDTPASILMRSTQLEPTPVVFGDAIRCVGVPIVRLGVGIAVSGVALNTFGHGAMAGSGTYYYQAWLRSTPVSYCDPAAAFTASNGVTLTW